MEYKCFEREWIEHLDPHKIDLFSIQFANAQRIIENDIVYLFDEVGSGKTISAGIMAMECLESFPNENVLIISTPSVAGRKGEESKPFLDDWISPQHGKFDTVVREMGWTDRIEIINNDYRNIKEKNETNYALGIIDEAHLFLENMGKDYAKKMRQELEQIKCKKLVFATATPIKESFRDLMQYIDIAKKMLPKEKTFGQEFEEEEYKKIFEFLNPAGKEEYELPCCIFNVEQCGTRYFKDTIKRLTAEGENICPVLRHSIEKPWEWDRDSKEDEYTSLAKKIDGLIESNHRVIVFTQYICDAGRIRQSFIGIGYRDILDEYGNAGNNNKKVAMVTGDNKDDLYLFTGLDSENGKKTTDVLVLTRQIAEAGVNFPRFDCVVNYNISEYPSSLEQRFGRVDRINSVSTNINMFYWFGSRWSSISNYYNAYFRYIHQLLPIIPVRNILLSKTVIDDIENSVEKHKVEDKKIKSGWINTIRKSIDLSPILTIKRGDEIVSFLSEILDEIGRFDDAKKILDDVDSISIDLSDDKDRFLEILSDKERELDLNIVRLDDEEIDYAKQMTATENSAFYLNAYREIKSVSLEKCWEYVKKSIDLNNKFTEEFSKMVKIPLSIKLLLDFYGDKVNQVFIDRYYKNEFLGIFPVDGVSDDWFYNNILEDIFNDLAFEDIYDHMDEETKKTLGDKEEYRGKINDAIGIIKDKAKLFIRKLPFFRDFEKFRNALTERVNKYVSFPDYDHIYSAMFRTLFLRERSKFDGAVIRRTSNDILQASPEFKLTLQALGEENLKYLYKNKSGQFRVWTGGIPYPVSGVMREKICDDVWTMRIMRLFFNENDYRYPLKDAVWEKHRDQIDEKLACRFKEIRSNKNYEDIKGFIPQIDGCIVRSEEIESAITDIIPYLDRLYLMQSQKYGLKQIFYIEFFLKLNRRIDFVYTTNNGHYIQKCRDGWGGDSSKGYYIEYVRLINNLNNEENILLGFDESDTEYLNSFWAFFEKKEKNNPFSWRLKEGFTVLL